MLTFGLSYRKVQSIIPQEEFNLLKKAYGLYQFGPKQSYYLSGNLISSISRIMGGKTNLHDVYPHVFTDNNNIDTLEKAISAVGNILK